MLEFIIIIVLCFFASIGMAHIYNRYISGIFRTDKNLPYSPSIIFTVKNRQDDIEAIIRSFIWKFFMTSGNNEILKITVVDLNSADETMSILKKLESEYGFLSVFDKQSYINNIEHL